jgi:hypothetical protein
MATEDKKQKPVKEFRMGAIKAAVWKREHEGKTFYNVSISRSFKVEPDGPNDDGWRENNSFDFAELETVKLVAELGAKFIKNQLLEAV